MINALKHPSFFRPTSSRPASPAPPPLPTQADLGQPMDKLAHPLNKLSLNNFRRPSPVLAAPFSAAPLVQDGTYLEMMSLKFSEAVSKALAQPTGPANPIEILGGKRPIPPGRGSALGALIATELNSSRDNTHLYRAILRCLHRPLSVLLNNLSSILLPLLASPAFLDPLAPTAQAPNPNTTQLHALAIAKFAEELLEVFDRQELGTDSDARGDGLRSIREGLVSLINKIITPLVAGIRNELLTLVGTLERPSPAAAKVPTGTKSTVHHSSIIHLQTTMPLYARALARYATSAVSQATLANLLISVLWKAMVALSNRTDIAPTPPPSPSVLALAPTKKRRGSPSSSTTPPVTPPPSRFMLKLPPSRPPSPPAGPTVATAATDCRTLFDLVNMLPRPCDDKPSSKLAREAVDEAFEGLNALAVFLDAIQGKMHDKSAAEVVDDLRKLTDELPTLIALPPLLRMYCPRDISAVSDLLGLSEEEYRRGCLSGFGRAEECANAVGHRVVQYLQTDPEGNIIVLKWLEYELDMV